MTPPTFLFAGTDPGLLSAPHFSHLPLLPNLAKCHPKLSCVLHHTHTHSEAPNGQDHTSASMAVWAEEKFTRQTPRGLDGSQV